MAMRMPILQTEMGMGKRINRLAAAVFSVALVCSCAPNQRIVESNGQWSNSQASNASAMPVKSSFEQDIQSMKTADFTFVYVFRRKDGQPLDAEDKRFASNAIPPEMNRRTVSDEGKAIIIGSNFRMPADNMDLLTQRFALEDRSVPVDPKTSPIR